MHEVSFPNCHASTKSQSQDLNPGNLVPRTCAVMCSTAAKGKLSLVSRKKKKKKSHEDGETEGKKADT